jgi:hypothetical protein
LVSFCRPVTVLAEFIEAANFILSLSRAVTVLVLAVRPVVL